MLLRKVLDELQTAPGATVQLCSSPTVPQVCGISSRACQGAVPPIHVFQHTICSQRVFIMKPHWRTWRGPRTSAAKWPRWVDGGHQTAALSVPRHEARRLSSRRYAVRVPSRHLHTCLSGDRAEVPFPMGFSSLVGILMCTLFMFLPVCRSGRMRRHPRRTAPLPRAASSGHGEPRAASSGHGESDSMRLQQKMTPRH